jgi:hypothetical protein
MSEILGKIDVCLNIEGPLSEFQDQLKKIRTKLSQRTNKLPTMVELEEIETTVSGCNKFNFKKRIKRRRSSRKRTTSKRRRSSRKRTASKRRRSSRKRTASKRRRSSRKRTASNKKRSSRK